MTDENYELKPLPLFTRTKPTSLTPGSLRFNVNSVKKLDSVRFSDETISTTSNNNATITSRFVPIIDNAVNLNNSILDQVQKDPSEEFYETSPFQYGFEEIQSFQASKYLPDLYEPINDTIKVYQEPYMKYPLASNDIEIDYSSMTSDTNVVLKHVAPFCDMPELKLNDYSTLDNEYDEVNNNNDILLNPEITQELRLMHILDFEMEEDNPPSLNLFKSFISWIKNKPDYYERYPWCKFVQQNRTDPLDFENINDLFLNTEFEKF